jgi:hypothetical protein
LHLPRAHDISRALLLAPFFTPRAAGGACFGLNGRHAVESGTMCNLHRRHPK